MSVFSIENIINYSKHEVRPGCSTDYHFTHARPTMCSILLVIVDWGESERIGVNWVSLSTRLHSALSVVKSGARCTITEGPRPVMINQRLSTYQSREPHVRMQPH